MEKDDFRSRLVEDAKILEAAPGLTEEQRLDLVQWRRELEAAPAATLEAMAFFLQHMPEDEADVELIILKGHLLIEQATRDFLRTRMLSPDALDGARLSSNQLFHLAEALCFPNPDPAWLWGMARRLNKIRNHLSHRLEAEKLGELVRGWIADYRAQHTIRSDLRGALGHLYGQVAELARLSKTDEFAVLRKQTRST